LCYQGIEMLTPAHLRRAGMLGDTKALPSHTHTLPEGDVVTDQV
jgi:hypothetical protein